MTCLSCGRYSPPDPTTGHDCDDVCPHCQLLLEREANTTADEIDTAAIAHQSALQDIATIGAEAMTTTDRARLWELLTAAQDVESRAQQLVNDIFAQIGTVLAAADDDETPGECPF